MLLKTDTNQEPIKQRDLVEQTRHRTIEEEKAAERRESFPLTPDAGMDVTDPEQRAGRPMSCWTLQEKLRRIAPFLYFEKSNSDPSKTGIYLRSSRRDISLYKGDLVFICGMESGIMPEFSVVEAEAKEIPDMGAPGGVRIQMGMAREIRGWRTVLSRLLKQQVITAGDIERQFQITLGRNSAKWHELLNGRMELFSQEAVSGKSGETVRTARHDDGSGHDDDKGTSQAGRRDAGEEGAGPDQAGSIAETNGGAGEDRDRSEAEKAGTLLTP